MLRSLKSSYLFTIFSISLLCIVCSCKKEKIKPIETGTVTDYEGNIYKTIKIGEQWWMAENLKATRYNDGNFITLIEDNAILWANDTAGAYRSGAYGFLYNWHAVNATKHQLAPSGWHVPTDNDWKELEKFLGMNASDVDRCNWRGTNEGDKLKSTGIESWIYYAPDPTVWATNESGFSALPGNCLLFNGGSGYPIGAGYMGFWWSSTESDSGESFYRYLDYKRSGIFRYYGPKTYGFSVRCVKD